MNNTTRQTKNARVFELIAKIKRSSKAQTIFEVVKKLQSLQGFAERYGNDGQGERVDINEVINKMDLPFDVHLFITGNFSDLMEIDFTDTQTDLKINK